MPSDEDIIRQCSWCRGVWDEATKKWIPFPDIIPGATHGMCKPCEKKQYAEWGLGDPDVDPGAEGKNPMKTHTMEIVKMIATHVFTGKKMELVFLINRRKGERLIDPILRDMNLGGMYVQKVTKMRPRKKTILLSQTEKK